MMGETEPDRARWFDALGTCACGKPANGILRGPANEAIEVCCERCAGRRIAKAQRNRGLDPTRPFTERGQEWWERLPDRFARKLEIPD